MNGRKSTIRTPQGATVSYEAKHADGAGFYYFLPGCVEIRNWGPFPTRDIAERWHEKPSSITPDDVKAIRKTQGYET